MEPEIERDRRDDNDLCELNSGLHLSEEDILKRKKLKSRKLASNSTRKWIQKRTSIARQMLIEVVELVRILRARDSEKEGTLSTDKSSNNILGAQSILAKCDNHDSQFTPKMGDEIPRYKNLDELSSLSTDFLHSQKQPMASIASRNLNDNPKSSKKRTHSNQQQSSLNSCSRNFIISGKEKCDKDNDEICLKQHKGDMQTQRPIRIAKPTQRELEAQYYQQVQRQRREEYKRGFLSQHNEKADSSYAAVKFKNDDTDDEDADDLSSDEKTDKSDEKNPSPSDKETQQNYDTQLAIEQLIALSQHARTALNSMSPNSNQPTSVTEAW